MQKWEYKYFEVDTRGNTVGITKLNLAFPSAQEFLDYMGEQGWELVSVFVGAKGYGQHFFFKRPKE